ncbi:cysteine desulfurase family protein [Paenibacillus ginsengarvi]|uniref:Cysteine desulfurase n=1 Tax=Paenibacillus ginsengarvi TaxID=400777 RepID=A0A3B0CUA6_9BACL|nr:cysteine desulfurase family protein [Paenibacillus ginsengarvi]RKN86938.1 cysteine desulfurase [Paenibacillus ginsengarvi]
MLYFDHAATTPPYDSVIEAVGEVMGRHFGNPSSIHRIGIDAERLVTKARDVMAKVLRAEAEEIVFTSGGTESNNMAVVGSALQHSGRGKHIITSAIEHASVYECFQHLERLGFEVTYIRPDRSGIVRASEVEAALREDTILVSVMHVNNEIGTLQPIAGIAEAIKRHSRALFHVDAVQSVGKLPVYPLQLGVDLLSASAHKFRGPKGTGFLYKRKGVRLQPLLIGGGQEEGLRSGTENVPGIVGMAKALRMAAENREAAFGIVTALRKRLLQRLAEIPELQVVGSANDSEMAPHIVGLTAHGFKTEVIVHAMEDRGICLSTKSACSSGEDRPSRVLLATGLDKQAASGGLRISLSAEHTLEQIDKLADALQDTIQSLRRFR